MRGKFGTAIGGQALFDESPEGLGDLARTLPAPKPETKFGARLRREHGFRTLPRIASNDPVDVASWPRPDHFEHAAALLACRHRKPKLAEKGAFVEGQFAPLPGYVLRHLAHAIVEAGERDAPFFVAQIGNDLGKHMNGVDRRSAKHAGMEI